MLQSFTFIMLMTGWLDQAKAVDKFGSLAAYKATLSVIVIFILVLAVAFASLWAFHTYLVFEGIGTYAWMVRSRERAMKRKERARVKAHDAAMKRKKRRSR